MALGFSCAAVQGGTMPQAVCSEDCALVSFPVVTAFTCADGAWQGSGGLCQVLTPIT